MMNKVLAIMQPTVLPWAGYFNLMHMADDFVFYNDIQLEKQSWQTRNRLLFGGKAEWVSIPIEHISKIQKISETRTLIDNKWKNRFNFLFNHNYKKHQYFGSASEIVECFLDFDTNFLTERNEAVINFVANRLNIKTRIHRSNELEVTGVRSERLIEFCRYFDADAYLSPAGSSDYLLLDRFAERSPSKLIFQKFEALPYEQLNSEKFISHLSIVDAVANLGWDRTREYVVSQS